MKQADLRNSVQKGHQDFRTPSITKEDGYDPEQAGEGDTQMEYFLE